MPTTDFCGGRHTNLDFFRQKVNVSSSYLTGAVWRAWVLHYVRKLLELIAWHVIDGDNPKFLVYAGINRCILTNDEPDTTIVTEGSNISGIFY